MSNARASVPRLLSATLWSGAVFLVLIGLAAAAGRATFIGDLAYRVEPLRIRMFHAFGYNDASVPHLEADLKEVDDKYGGHRWTTLLHVVPGGLFLLLAPIQFIPAIRNRHLRAHRRLGRVLMVAALVSGACGLFFGLVRPFGGVTESIAIAIFGSLLFISVIRAYVAIRKGQVAIHREWMIRAFAIALAISMVRVIASAFDIARVGVNNLRGMFSLSIWSGWLITLAIAELWIRYSRGRFSLPSPSPRQPQLRSPIPVPESPLISRDVSTL